MNVRELQSICAVEATEMSLFFYVKLVNYVSATLPHALSFVPDLHWSR